MIDNSEKIEQFLHLRSKTLPELRAICEGLSIETEGSETELINRIIGTSPNTPQVNPTLPQAISLRSRNDLGETNLQAVAMFRKWRKQIFEGRGNVREFGLLNAEGESYQQRMKFIPCDVALASSLIKKEWYFPHDSQKDLLNLIRNQPENFNFAIVRKENTNGSSFLMLHCAPKRAA